MPIDTHSQLPDEAVRALIHARHGDPFAVLGMHVADGGVVVRALLPQASRVQVVDAADGHVAGELPLINSDGLFGGTLPDRHTPFAYRLRVTLGTDTHDIEDPYRFGPILSDLDLYLFGEGTHRRLYDRFGAHPVSIDDVYGVTFVVWAPNAQRVSVVGDFNDWDGRRHVMRRRTSGVWEIFLPDVPVGSRYKYELIGPHGNSYR